MARRITWRTATTADVDLARWDGGLTAGDVIADEAWLYRVDTAAVVPATGRKRQHDQTVRFHATLTRIPDGEVIRFEVQTARPRPVDTGRELIAATKQQADERLAARRTSA